MKKPVILIILTLLLCPVSYAGTTSFTFGEGAFGNVPEPRLRYPINEKVILSAGQSLEFSWWNDVAGIRGFILKIYKGYNMFAANLIHKEELPPGASSLKIDPALFENGQVYTWSLIRVSFDGTKSDRSFNSFKVVKE